MTPFIRSWRPLVVSLAAGIVALFLQTIAIAQQTIAFGGQNDGGADVFTVVLSGSPLSFGTPTLVTNNPEPWASADEFPPAVSALAFAQNNNSLVGSNRAYGDLYSLAGPSYATSTQLAALSAGFLASSVGVESNGTIVGVGTNQNGCIEGPCPAAIALFPTGQTLLGSWTVLDNLSTHWAIGTAADAVVATGNYGVAQTGDVLVLAGDVYGTVSTQPVILRYPQSAIASGSCDGCGSVVANQGQFPLNTLSTSPVYPVSLDISPVDGSILVATSDGSIWRLPYNAAGNPLYGPPQLLACSVEYDVVNNVPVCQASPGNPWGKIRATQSGGQLYIVSTNPSASQVNLFTGAVATPPFMSNSTVSLSQYGVQPIGLAVLPTYRSGTVTASQCIAPLACDPIGDGVELITIRDYPPVPPAFFPPTAPISEQECDVAVDPRIPLYGSCLGHSLPLSQVCPGLSDSTVIPQYVCGSPGFVIIAALADQIAANSNGLEVAIKSTSAPIFPSSPTCPQNVHILASNDHSQVETTFAEGPNAFENTGFCYSDPGSGSLGPHKTIDGIGLVLDLTSFAPGGTAVQQAVKFTDFKIQNLITTINQTSVKYFWEKLVLLLGADIDQYLVNKGHYDCAAELVYLLDQFVRRHRADFRPTGTAGATVREPNGFGDIIGRLANLYLTIENRIEGKTVTWSDWPLAADPHLCHTNECNVSGLNK